MEYRYLLYVRINEVNKEVNFQWCIKRWLYLPCNPTHKIVGNFNPNENFIEIQDKMVSVLIVF